MSVESLQGPLPSKGEEEMTVHGTAAGGVRSFLIQLMRRMGAQLYRNPLKLFRQSQVKFSLFDIFKHTAQQGGNAAGAGAPHKKTDVVKDAMSVAKKEGYGRTLRKALLPFGVNVFIGMSMFTTYDLVVEKVERRLGPEATHADVPLVWFFLGGAASGCVQSTLASPYDNVYKEYTKLHHSYTDSLRVVWTQGNLFHGYRRLLATELCGLSIFFGGYEGCKRLYCQHLFSEKFKVANIVAAGLSAGLLYNVVSYPISRLHTGPRQCFRGLFPQKAFASMPANAIGFLLYELTLSPDDSHLTKM